MFRLENIIKAIIYSLVRWTRMLCTMSFSSRPTVFLKSNSYSDNMPHSAGKVISCVESFLKMS